MIVQLYNFAKKQNSTAQPSGTGDQYDCRLKDQTSITDPVILLDLNDKVNFTKYTYAYIPEFNRYYFVSDMVADGLCWSVYLTCDVLATYKTDIGNSTMYVLRSAAAYDGDMVDDYYPIGVTHTNNRTTADNPLTANGSSAFVDVDSGCFVVGVVGQQTGSYNYGSVRYYAFTRANLNNLVSSLLGQVAEGVNGFHAESNDPITIELQKSIIDPLQFIKSCIWVPVDYNTISNILASGSLNIFGWTVSATNKQLNNNPPQKTLTTTIDIPKHPLAASRGVYMNTEPFSRYQLLYPPFGMFDLDTAAMCSGTQLAITVYLDLITGVGTLRVAGEGDGKYLINAKTQVGVPINLTQVTHDYLGAAGGMAGGLIGAIGNAVAGNIAGASLSVMGMVGSAANIARPSASSIGGNGGFSDITGRITLLAQFYHMPGEDNSHAGRPLCDNRQLSTLPGFQKIMDGDVTISGTAGEQAAIKSFLEGGYFYE